MASRFISCLLVLIGCSAGFARAQSPARLTLASSIPSPASNASAAAVVPTPSLAVKADSVFVNPEVRPQFTGGEAGLREYLMKNLRYPDQALRQHVSGKVYVRFILNAAGRVTDASVVRGPGSGLNEEGLRLVWMMPAWQPARQRGQAVRVSCTLPITFQE